MNRRRFVAAVAATALTGCAGQFGGDERSRLDLTVQNDRAEPVAIDVAVVDDEGTTYADESDRIDGGVARAFEVVVGTDGRHEVTVAGDDWRGQLAWNAETCARFDGTVGVTAERVEVASECTDLR